MPEMVTFTMVMTAEGNKEFTRSLEQFLKNWSKKLGTDLSIKKHGLREVKS